MMMMQSIQLQWTLLVIAVWRTTQGFMGQISSQKLLGRRPASCRTLPSPILTHQYDSSLISPSRVLWVVPADAGEDDEGKVEEDGASSSSFPTLASSLKGKDRRALRALAGRKKNDKSLFTMQQSDSEPCPQFLAEIESALRAHELINVRVLFAERKKEAKAVGTHMASSTSAELVQVIGHTYLLYKPSNPPKIDLSSLIQPKE